MKNWKEKVIEVILIIIGLLVACSLLFIEPPHLFKMIIDAITRILFIGICIVYIIIYVTHLNKTK